MMPQIQIAKWRERENSAKITMVRKQSKKPKGPGQSKGITICFCNLMKIFKNNTDEQNLHHHHVPLNETENMTSFTCNLGFIKKQIQWASQNFSNVEVQMYILVEIQQ